MIVPDELGEQFRNMREEGVGPCAECGRETNRFIPPFNNWWCRECQEKRNQKSQLVFHRSG